MDIAKQTLIEAGKLYPGVHIIRRDWHKTRLPDESFKLVTGFNADSQNATPQRLGRFLKEMHRVLAPGGRMCFISISSPATETWGEFKPLGVPEIDYGREINAQPRAIEEFQRAEDRIP